MRYKSGNLRYVGAPLVVGLDEMAKVCVLLVSLALVLLLLTVVTFNTALRVDQVTTSLLLNVDAAALLTLTVLAKVAHWILLAERIRAAALMIWALFLGGAVLASIFLFEPRLVSDFETMWVRANEFAFIEFAVRDIYDQRIQLLLVPAVRMFGAGEWVIVFVNVTCLSITLAAGGLWVWRVAGPIAALLFCFVFASVPELLLALGIPTHDLWALPWIALVALAVQRSLLPELSRVGLVFWAAVAAVAMVLLQVQREIGHVAWVAAVLTYLVNAAVVPKGPLGSAGSELLPSTSRRAAGASLICTLVLVLSYPAGLAAASGFGMFAGSASYQELVHARVGGVVPSIVRGTYGDGRAIADNFLEALPPERRGDFAQDVAVSDALLQPERRFPNALHRMKTLSYLGSQSYFYVPGLEQRRPTLSAFIASLTSWHAVGFALLVLWSLVSMFQGGYWQSYLFPILFSSVLVAGLVLVGEVQPRYLIPLWFTGSLLVASLAPKLRQAKGTRGVRSFAYIAFLFILIYLGWRMVDRLYTHDDGRIIEWTLEEPGISQGAALASLMGDERSNAIGSLGFALQLPESKGVVERGAHSRVCTSGPAVLEFFYYMPYHQSYALEYFQLSLRSDDAPLWSVGLPSAQGVQHAVVDLPAGGCRSLEFVLSAANGVSDVSWVNASRTEIYFARVARSE